jgi:hypothetical protein
MGANKPAQHFNVGDLVRYAQAYDWAYKLGIVVRLGRVKASVLWTSGDITFPTINSLEVISESR